MVVAAMQRTLDVAQEIERTGLGADGGCGVSTPRALTPIGACLFGAGGAARAVATVQLRIPGDDVIAGGALRIRLQPALCPTDDQFYEFCRLNRDLRIERGPEGDVTIMAPAGWESGRRNAEITSRLQVWAKGDGTGVAVDASGRSESSALKGGTFE